jgi:3-hydroxy-9,10-secoandrosta-1,3,5(10)-triene-9,17-dione monooxygenase
LSARIDPPEPDLTPDELVARADALRPELVERQAETEELTYYPQSTHEAFVEAGFYRILVPRRFGGYEFDLPTFWRVVVALARGCPSTAWCFCLGAGRALQVGAWFDQEAQAEFFGDGHFIAPSVTPPAGVAQRADDGWILNGTHPYSSGAPYATHFMGQTFTPGDEPGSPPGPMMLFVAPRSTWTMLNDWGDILGMKGSGSHSVRFENAFIPSHYALEDTWMVNVDVSRGSPGLQLHGNPMYAGRTACVFQGEISAIMVGAAKGALDEYEEIITTRKTMRPPIVERYRDPDYQRWYGIAVGKIATAEAALIQVAEQYMDACRGAADDGVTFSREEDLRLNIVGRETMALAWEAMQNYIFKTAGSSAAKKGERMERIYRDMSTGWSHFQNLLGDWTSRELALEHFGLMLDREQKPDRLHR